MTTHLQIYKYAFNLLFSFLFLIEMSKKTWGGKKQEKKKSLNSQTSMTLLLTFCNTLKNLFPHSYNYNFKIHNQDK